MSPGLNDRHDLKDIASFDLVRHHRANERIFLYAFDLIELIGDDLRRDPLEGRKATMEMVRAKAGPGIQFNEHMEGKGLSLPFRPIARAQNEKSRMRRL